MASTNFIDNLTALQANLLNFAYMLTNNRDDAYDLLQDTMVKALDNEEKYTAGTNFKGWVFTIMRNTFINGYRRTSRMPTVVDRTDDLFYLNFPRDDGPETPEDAIGALEIQKAIADLPDDMRIPFSMHVAGYKYSEIAEHTRLPIGTVKSRIFFARRRLQQRLRSFRQ